MMSPIVVVALKKNKSIHVHPYDSSAARNFRPTDIYTHRLYIPWTCDRKNSLHVVSSVLHSGLYINTLLSCCRETWGGERLARGGRGGWKPIASTGLQAHAWRAVTKGGSPATPS
jgi:hypothetical protein